MMFLLNAAILAARSCARLSLGGRGRSTREDGERGRGVKRRW
jgi:hypothetical protein